jgi:2-polyprenyl-6-hydroxyphenyl methylase/3-demethylubiquinone-9 3-methyltransferase
VIGVRRPGRHPRAERARLVDAFFEDLAFAVFAVGHRFTEAVSFQVFTADQEETDRYWDALVNGGGEESMCGWCKDRFGLSWQITPKALTEAVFGSDREAAARAFAAMLKMKKIDIATIEAAREGQKV